jgi:hypothetical protein
MRSTKYLTVLFLAGLTHTTVTSVVSILSSEVCSLKYLVYGLMPTTVLTLFLLAGFIYAAGQAFGAETKARAQGWAISMLTGGIIGILIIILAPALISIFTTGTVMEDYLFCTTN